MAVYPTQSINQKVILTATLLTYCLEKKITVRAVRLGRKKKASEFIGQLGEVGKTSHNQQY